MAILKRAGGALFAVAAVAAAVGLSTAPAMASTTLTAKVSGGGTITATAKTTVLGEKVDGVNVNVTCSTKGKTAASVSSGPVKSGTYKGASPLKVGTASKLAFNNCTGLLGKVTNKPESLPYNISVDSTTNSKGETDGIIGPVKVAVSMKDCSFMVTGSAPGYFDNSNHTLVVTNKLPVKPLESAQLTISGVKKGTCAGLIADGQHPTYTGTYSINLKISIKST
jgi:hypothetical protein